ncbi:MAG: protein jag [Bacilli bacterium]
MINILEYEGKTETEAFNNCLKDLKCSEKELLIRYEIEEGNLFKKKKYILYAIKKENIKIYITNFFEEFSDLMNINITSEIIENDYSYNITLVSAQNSILIGREGKTLNAIQTLLRQIIKNQTKINLKINVDISNYKLKKLKNLENEIKKIAEDILKNKIHVSLDTMNSNERRMIHSLISNYNHLQTESVGDGKERHIVIKYKEI